MTAPNRVQYIFGVYDPVSGKLLGVAPTGNSPYAAVPGSATIVTNFPGIRLQLGAQAQTLFATGKVTQADGGGGTFVLNTADTTSGAWFTASVSGSVLTVLSVNNGTLAVGQSVNRGDTGVPIATITSLGTGTGGTGTYNLSASATILSPIIFTADNNSTVLVGADGSRWDLAPQASALTSSAIYGTDSGAANAYVFTHSVTSEAATLAAGTLIRFVPLNTNTSAATLNADGSGAVAVIRANGAALTGGEFSSLGPVVLQSTGTQWQIVSTAGAQPGYERTPAETAALVIPVNYGFLAGIADRYGNNAVPGTTDMTTAIQNALASNPTATLLAATYLYASVSTLQMFGKRLQGQGIHATRLIMPNVAGGAAWQIGGTDTAGPGISGMIIAGGDPITGGSNSTAYSGLLYAQTGVGCRRSLNSDVLVLQFTRSDPITFTGALLANATSGTLNANWTLPTNSYEVMFSDGEVRIVYLTNGATTATWPLGLTNGVTANALVLTGAGIDLSAALSAGVYYNGFTNVTCGGTTLRSITFTGAPAGGATSATLTANWPMPTGVYAVQFSDNEVRLVTLTNGATTATWVIGLVNGVTTAAVVTGGNAAGWRSHTSDGPANGNRINANSWVNSGGVFNMGAHFMFDYAAADTLHAADREVSSAPGIHVGTNVFGLTVLGGDDENNSNSVLIESPSSDIHLLGGNLVPIPGTSGWTVSSQFWPGGSQATNFGVAPNSAAINFTIGGATINYTGVNPSEQSGGSTIRQLDSTNKAGNWFRRYKNNYSVITANTSTVSFAAVTAPEALVNLVSGTNVTTVTMPAVVDGLYLTLTFQQPAAGSTVTVSGWPASVHFAGGAFTLTATLGKVDQVVLEYVASLSMWVERSRSLNM